MHMREQKSRSRGCWTVCTSERRREGSESKCRGGRSKGDKVKEGNSGQEEIGFTLTDQTCNGGRDGRASQLSPLQTE